MGKHEVGTPKYIANKIKAKGLQKLRWYCQMCEKQCRDENGFKCHTLSESHQRQLLLFADNPNRFMDEFSSRFEKEFLDLLRFRFGTKRVHANKVYQEYIADRKHLHMNATQWETLTDFVKWLGRDGKCVADETEKGWFITYIDRSPETIQQEESKAKKEKMDKDDEERMQKFIERQVALGKKTATTQESAPTELQRSEGEKLSLKLEVKHTKQPEIKPATSKPSVFEEASSSKTKKAKKPDVSLKRTGSALDDIIKEEEERKEKKRRKDYWLTEDIVVKVVTKTLGDEFFGQKGVVTKVIDKYACIVKLLSNKKKLKLDQEHLETVIPAIGKKVKILNGGYSGLIAELLGINSSKFSADVKLLASTYNGRTVRDIAYEDFSKLYEET